MAYMCICAIHVYIDMYTYIHFYVCIYYILCMHMHTYVYMIECIFREKIEGFTPDYWPLLSWGRKLEVEDVGKREEGDKI